MNRALIGVPALAVAACCIGGPAQALPAGPPRAAITAAQSPPLLPVYGHHRYHSRRGHNVDSAPAAADSVGVKPGQWEFTTRLDAFATPPPPGAQSPQGQSPPATKLQSGGGATYLSCIQSDRPEPFQFDGATCKLDSRERQGPRITWSMTCTNPQGAVRSDGVAQYRGDTMDGTLINHFPAANGTVTDLTQRITGRYLGACPQTAAAPPPRPNPLPDASSGSSSQWVEPPAASGGAKPSGTQRPAASASAAPPAAQPPSASARATPSAASGPAKPSAASPQNTVTAAEARPPPRTRYARHHRHYYRRYYGSSGGAWPGGGGLFGIRIPFLGGL